VLALWRSAGAVETTTDDAEALHALLGRDPGALLLAEEDGDVVGVLIAGWNGWRGSFYRLAVRPDRRRAGIATRLVRAGEERLAALGARRLDAIVVSDEDDAARFWAAAGYEQQSKRLRFVRNL
jgi:ribosomal protein S18 acetylase RimI-like enzyme